MQRNSPAGERPTPGTRNDRAVRPGVIVGTVVAMVALVVVAVVLVRRGDSPPEAPPGPGPTAGSGENAEAQTRATNAPSAAPTQRPGPADASARGQRTALIDDLLSVTQDPAAVRNLERARATLAKAATSAGGTATLTP